MEKLYKSHDTAEKFATTEFKILLEMFAREFFVRKLFVRQGMICHQLST